MDTLTHIAIGACIGDAFAGKQLGRKAMLWGALAQSMPDIDFIAGAWQNPANHLLAHRGFTHSFLFIFLVSPLFALLSERWHKKHDISIYKWILFWAVQMLLHIFIDAFNMYGTGWFEPFSHYRVSFDSIFVADPFFSIGPVLAFLTLLVYRGHERVRKLIVIAGLSGCVFYLPYSINNKKNIDTTVKALFAEQEVTYSRLYTTPTPLNNWLWYIVAESDSGYHIGYRSIFDNNHHIPLHYYPRNNELLKEYSHEDVQHLLRFSQGYYTVEKWHDTLVFNDLRFGQILGWQDSSARFVFHYFLREKADNDLVVQRGRFAKFDKEALTLLIKRIQGD